MDMMNRMLWVLLPLLVSCSSQKQLEYTTPFRMGEPYVQPYVTATDTDISYYEVMIPILSLDKENAELQQLYYKGMQLPLQITLKDIGNVAIARYTPKDIAESQGTDTRQQSEKNDTAGQATVPFPFELSETQAVISYVQKDRVKYAELNGIRLNPAVQLQGDTEYSTY